MNTGKKRVYVQPKLDVVTVSMESHLLDNSPGRIGTDDPKDGGDPLDQDAKAETMWFGTIDDFDTWGDYE